MSTANQSIQIQLKRMEKKKQTLMNLIQELSEQSYSLQHNEYTWSVGQVANHLYLSERLSLAYLKKKLTYPDTIPAFSIKSLWSLFFVNFTLWSPVKVKAPVMINMWEKQEVLSPDDLQQRWTEVRRELEAIIMENQPRFSSHLVYNHPFAGRMTMKQMLIFINHHMAHHLRQARRIIRKIN